MKQHNIEERYINKLKVYSRQVNLEDKTNREAMAAKLYFRRLYGKEFNRDIASGINSGLNYGYKIIASYISKSLAARGLITQLGIKHCGGSNAFNLTYDFIEVFRVIIDNWVFYNLDMEDELSMKNRHDLVDIVNVKVKINNKTYRLSKAIEIIIDSFINYLNKESDEITMYDFSKINYDTE